MQIKRKLVAKAASGLLAVGLLLATAMPALAQEPGPARDANWTVSITYANIGNQATPVTLSLYPEGSATPITLSASQLGEASNPLEAGAATSFFVGRVSDPNFANGNGVMSSEQPLAATVVQFSQDPGYFMRLLYNGFPDSKSSSQYLISTALKNQFGRTTVFSIQNTESQAIDATIEFIDASNGSTASTQTFEIPANSSKFIEMDDPADTGINAGSFNGSAVVTAELAGSDTEAEVVAAASEYYVDRPVATNFEGLPLAEAANTLYMATGLCQRFGLDTFYAIQNASLTDNANNVTITYYDTSGAQIKTEDVGQIGPGQKYSARTCLDYGGAAADPDMVNFSGSAVITSDGAPLVAIGKAQNSINAGGPDTESVLTAFLGEPSGYTNVSQPFVRWANDSRFNASTGGEQRAFIAIQNVDPNNNANVSVEYVDNTGAVVATENFNIPPRAKANSNPNNAGALGQNGMNPGEFGYYTNGAFGGGVIINSDQPVIAIARVQHPGAGEDYNGVEIP